ncbi:MAG: cell division protein FtsL [Firmicutes bacterium]|nr:cell division protein FtsL [Bacillota bacterium]
MDEKEQIGTREQKNESRRESRRKKGKLIFGSLFFLVVVLILFAIFHQYRIRLDLNSKEAVISKELDKEKAENAALQKELENENAPEFIEKIAREKLNMVRPTEIVFNDVNTSGKRMEKNIENTNKNINESEEITTDNAEDNASEEEE